MIQVWEALGDVETPRKEMGRYLSTGNGVHSRGKQLDGDLQWAGSAAEARVRLLAVFKDIGNLNPGSVDGGA